jgi:hypothetical protein
MLLGILTPIITSVKSFQQAEVPTIHQREFPSKENAIIVTAAVSCTEHSMDFSVTGPILPITEKIKTTQKMVSRIYSRDGVSIVVSRHGVAILDYDA